MPERSFGFGASAGRPPTLPVGATARFAKPKPPAKDGLAGRAPGGGGGGIDVRADPPTLGLGFDIVIEGFLAFEGVPVRGVEAFDVVADNCFVGDLAGD
jgi:hypothetical protein